ncbi:MULTISPECIES: energy-coupling factor ABC transporter ATP-binding protein [Neobacillus]|uniref:ABC transporter ATP-binding protein n=1 Tax=Neobacillus rhizophilus TaxID=2833579 RepID=A0A942YXP3_9BACI|nr:MULTISPECIES: ABC transporter ATP-binding protein [Neobacillus]MBS4216209.1 ABC transporter ATP-binding protein [Neobacillus rhizophilus]MBU8917230.1 energy-coupling factor ABC transporter ATP-binding protein [Bacillus sp. FJAT-29953]
MSYIEMKGISYKYPVGDGKVLKDVNLSLEKGKVYALIGANGSGKTTICNLIRGFIPHFFKGDLDGEMLIEGKDIREWEMGDLAQKMGYIFQNPFTQISGTKDTVFEEIAFGLENLRVEVPVIKERVTEIIKLFGLEPLQNKDPQQLSGGQRQRVSLASVMVMDPEILIIDEPTSQLDPQATEEVFKIINIMKQKGKTIILVEHKIELIAEYADWVILVEDGKVVMEGKTKDILSDIKTVNHGVMLPQYALLGYEMRKTGRLNEIPITESEAITVFNNWIVGKEE